MTGNPQKLSFIYGVRWVYNKIYNIIILLANKFNEKQVYFQKNFSEMSDTVVHFCKSLAMSSLIDYSWNLIFYSAFIL